MKNSATMSLFKIQVDAMLRHSILALIFFVLVVLAASAVLHAQRRDAAKDPLERLMEEYIRNDNSDGLRNLRQLIELNIKEEPDAQKGYYLLGKLEMALGNREKAEEVWEKGLEAKNGYPRIYKMLAESYLQRGNGERFTESYYTWLEKETDKSLLNDEYELAELSMAADKRGEFIGLTIDERIQRLIVYWRSQDPYPITPMNEGLITHIKRIAYAKEHFGSQFGNMGFDDRGKVYVRYGEPELKYDLRRMHEFPVRNNESWYFPSLGLYMAYDFVDIGGGYYREVNSLMEALPGGATLENVAILYEERQELGGVYNMSEIQTPAGIVRDVPREKIRAHRTTDPRVEIELDMEPLEFFHRTVQFRGEEGKTTVELPYGVPLNQLDAGDDNDESIDFDFQIDVVLRDSLYRGSTRLENQHAIAILF